MDKCEVYWPTGDQSFPELLTQIKRLTRGIKLLGSPVYGEDDFIQATVARRIEKVIEAQSHLRDLDHLQVELQLLRSCLNVCKINNLLHTVVLGLVDNELTKFDASHRHSLELITRSSILDSSWIQATLPVRDGGLGLYEALSSLAAAFVHAVIF